MTLRGKISSITVSSITVDKKDLNPQRTFECGQVFRFTKNTESEYTVISENKKCLVKTEGKTVSIYAPKNELPYFKNYFDLETSYAPILRNLRNLRNLRTLRNSQPASVKNMMKDAIAYGRGIRLLRQDKFETLISFIISTNNNIPRIKSIIERICGELGTRCDTGLGPFHAFPTARAMAACGEDFYRKLGCGYRSKWICDAAQKAEKIDLESLGGLSNTSGREPRSASAAGSGFASSVELIGRLREFDGIGPKAADCIALFAYGRYDVFPVDTWVKKIYYSLFPGSKPVTEKVMREKLIGLFGAYAGIAQQFLFYYYRDAAPKHQL
jgi:N-glycosylase/DNA lyase